jgi:predicted MPP superfamily phosphohydrolase
MTTLEAIRSIFFLLWNFVLFGGMHIYLWRRWQRAFPAPGGIRDTILKGAGLFLFSIPFWIRWLERFGDEGLARALAYGGYAWMGWILFVFIFMATLDGLRLVLSRTFGKPAGVAPLLTTRTALLLSIVLALAVTGWGHRETRQIRVAHRVLLTAKLPPGVPSLRIVQISDLHLGLTTDQAWFEALTAAVRRTRPDIIVSTGDLADGHTSRYGRFLASLQAMEAPGGRFAVLGNHEHYDETDGSRTFLRQAGFRILRDQAVAASGLYVVGVDDPMGHDGEDFTEAEALLLKNAPGGRFVLLLKHRPIVPEETLGRFDLQLSGHTHGGQVFPVSLLTTLSYRYHRGFYALPRGSSLYVSPGAGASGPRIRFLSPPEITVIDLMRSGDPVAPSPRP